MIKIPELLSDYLEETEQDADRMTQTQLLKEGSQMKTYENRIIKTYTVYGPNDSLFIHYTRNDLDCFHPHPNYSEPYESLEVTLTKCREYFTDEIKKANLGLIDEEIKEAVDSIMIYAGGTIQTWWYNAEEEKEGN